MDLGCHLPTQGAVATREALTAFAARAEQHGMASLWVSDDVAIDFRRPSLAEMLEVLDLVATEIRPAVDRA
jgi:hypothetical protein